MKVKNLIWEDFVQYKKPSMFIGTTSCTWKCLKELDLALDTCQNCKLAQSKTIEIDDDELINKYNDNPITNAIVIGGLEPFDTFCDVYHFIFMLREKYKCNDDVVIYTGYNEDEINDKIDLLKNMPNIIIKFGRYIPNKPSIFDNILGVELASDNQYAKKL